MGPVNYDITPDGRELVFTRGATPPATEVDARGSVNVVLNWFQELDARAQALTPGRPGGDAGLFVFRPDDRLALIGQLTWKIGSKRYSSSARPPNAFCPPRDVWKP